MQATVLLAAERGFEHTRVSDIVGACGVGQGVFYWYFESKEALFGEILADTTMRLRMYQAGVIAGESDPVRRIARGIFASLDFIAHNLHAFAFLDHAQARLRAKRAEALRVHVVDTMSHIRQGQEEGLIRPGDAEAMAHAIAGVVDRLARAYSGRQRGDVAHVAQEAVDFCLGGILGSRTHAVPDLCPEPTRELAMVRDVVGAGGIAPAGESRRGR
jgi:AcrR family transcriptional regulator